MFLFFLNETSSLFPRRCMTSIYCLYINHMCIYIQNTFKYLFVFPPWQYFCLGGALMLTCAKDMSQLPTTGRKVLLHTCKASIAPVESLNNPRVWLTKIVTFLTFNSLAAFMWVSQVRPDLKAVLCTQFMSAQS